MNIIEFSDIEELWLLKRQDTKFKFVSINLSLHIQLSENLTVLFLENILTFKKCLSNTKYLLVMVIHL